MKRSNVFLRGDPPFRETSDFLIPDTLGGEKANLHQWERRMAHYDDKQGVWPDNELARRMAKGQKVRGMGKIVGQANGEGRTEGIMGKSCRGKWRRDRRPGMSG